MNKQWWKEQFTLREGLLTYLQWGGVIYFFIKAVYCGYMSNSFQEKGYVEATAGYVYSFVFALLLIKAYESCQKIITGYDKLTDRLLKEIRESEASARYFAIRSTMKEHD